MRGTRAIVRTLCACSWVMMMTHCGGGSSSYQASPSNSSPAITSVAISCPQASLPPGLMLKCSATVQVTGSFDTNVKWSASAGTVSDGLFTAPKDSGTVTVTATSAADASKSASATITITPPQKSAFEINGINHVSWWHDEYQTADAAKSESALAATGANYAGVLVTQYMATPTANTISATQQTPTDAAVTLAIQQLHSSGVKVMLKPHIDVADGTWRANIAPTDVNAWFANYKSFIVHYAEVAQSTGAEMLCIGTELKSMSGGANLARWMDVISAIRAVYSGKLTYAANAVAAGDEFTSVAFWDEMDVIGLDGYFPLTNQNEPSTAALVAALHVNAAGENVVAMLTNFANAHPSKPVIFTEIGYRSAVGANKAPWDYSQAAPPSNLEQQNCYEAMYEVWGQQGSPIKGAFWWSWNVPVPVAADTDYTPRNKPAQTVLENWQ